MFITYSFYFTKNSTKTKKKKKTSNANYENRKTKRKWDNPFETSNRIYICTLKFLLLSNGHAHIHILHASRTYLKCVQNIFIVFSFLQFIFFYFFFFVFQLLFAANVVIFSVRTSCSCVFIHLNILFYIALQVNNIYYYYVVTLLVSFFFFMINFVCKIMRMAILFHFMHVFLSLFHLVSFLNRFFLFRIDLFSVF